MEWCIPKNIKKQRGFMGLTRYYRKFVKNYGHIKTPLTTLLNKDSFYLNESTDISFEELKKATCTTIVFATLDFMKGFIMECDASRNRIGSILMQVDRPIAFESHQLKGKNLIKLIYEKEML